MMKRTPTAAIKVFALATTLILPAGAIAMSHEHGEATDGSATESTKRVAPGSDDPRRLTHEEFERIERDLDLAKTCGLDGEADEPIVADDTLELRVRKALEGEASLADDAIYIREVHDGEVRIDGEVDSLEEHRKALELVHGVSGVCKVVSDIRLDRDSAGEAG